MVSRRRIQERFEFASRTVHHHRIRPVLELLEGRTLLATFTVNSLGDVGSGSGDAGDLRYCINQANADNQANTIVFDSTVFKTPEWISGPFELSDTAGPQTITGPAAGLIIQDAESEGAGYPPVFQVDGGVTASISGVAIADNDTSFEGPSTVALENSGALMLDKCRHQRHPYWVLRCRRGRPC